MTFEVFFRLVSYAAVLCGFFALWISGTFGPIATLMFLGVMVAAWLVEGTRWQISERVGTALIVLALPAFYAAWRLQLITFQGGETVVAGILARMILSLTAIKLLQKKSDRDWIFLYLMSFFEVLLAAGLSISAFYLGSFLLYLLLMVCAVIAFEIRKTSRRVEQAIAGEEIVKDPKDAGASALLPVRGLPLAAITLIFVTILLATPLFFLLPRVGGAGYGGNQSGLATSSGFSDTVRLGGIGRIQQNDAVVMRVKLDEHAESGIGLYFRGVALDTFDNQTWSKSKSVKEPFMKGDRDMIQVDYPTSRENLSVQTIYLEPLDTQVLFALPKAVAIQGNFPILIKDGYGAITYQRSFERTSYKVLSDRGLPPIERLRADEQPYSAAMQNYWQLPEVYDPRINELASAITADMSTRYDRAQAIESYLQNNFGYTLEQKASGSEPLASFLFDVREGHCEYFATAMTVMLRTQGIASRVVNGFHGGEYNDTADVTVVRQRNAHAWVEVFFPKENVWVPFDPTPFGGEAGIATPTGIVSVVNKYLEALETFWIQYFVAFDNQEQRSLARSVRDGFVDYQLKASGAIGALREVLTEWWSSIRGDRGLRTSLIAAGYGIAYVVAVVLAVLVLLWLFRRILRWNLWQALGVRGRRHGSIVEFYDRLQRILALQGRMREPHQTPAEFAEAVGVPAAVNITEKYNRVRFGGKSLSATEADEIEDLLRQLTVSVEGGRTVSAAGPKR